MRLIQGDETTPLDSELTMLWGKPLTQRDVQISEALEWAVCGDYGVWSRTEYARRFRGTIYLDGYLPRFSCDQTLSAFVDRYALVQLDPFFLNTRDDAPLRVILTLAVLVMQGHAKYKASACGQYFTAAADLPYRYWPTEIEALVPDLILEGKLCAFLNIAGDDFVVTPTAASMLGKVSKRDLRDRKFRRILRHLEKVGLMRQRKGSNGLSVWKPTKKGRRLGCTSRTLPMGCVLEGIGLEDIVQDEEVIPFWWGEPSEPPKPRVFTLEDDVEWAFDRPLFLIRPTKHRHVVSPCYRGRS